MEIEMMPGFGDPAVLPSADDHAAELDRLSRPRLVAGHQAARRRAVAVLKGLGYLDPGIGEAGQEASMEFLEGRRAADIHAVLQAMGDAILGHQLVDDRLPLFVPDLFEPAMQERD